MKILYSLYIILFATVSLKANDHASSGIPYVPYMLYKTI